MFIDGGPTPVEIPLDVSRFPSLTIISPPQDQLAGSSKVKGPQIEHATPQALLPEQDGVPFRFFNIITSVICQHYQTQEKIFNSYVIWFQPCTTSSIFKTRAPFKTTSEKCITT